MGITKVGSPFGTPGTAVPGGSPVGHGAPRPGRDHSSRQSARRCRSSLYTRIVLMNAVVMVGALMLLLLTPVTLSARPTERQVVPLVTMFAVMVLATAVLLRLSFTGLAALVRRMDTLDVLRPRERLPEMGGAETRALISGFNLMLDRLETDRLASTRRSVDLLEGERQRISRELHDEVGQRMTGVLLQLGRIHGESGCAERLRITQVQDEVRAVMDVVGALAWQERPEILDSLGLLSALKSMTTSLNASATAQIVSVLPPKLPPMTADVELAVYRIAQEALTNALRHSGATTITVAMQVTPGELVLQITDDGRGLLGADGEDPGLRGMRERALLVAGRLDIQECPPHGLRVELVVPKHPQAG